MDVVFAHGAHYMKRGNCGESQCLIPSLISNKKQVLILPGFVQSIGARDRMHREVEKTQWMKATEGK